MKTTLLTFRRLAPWMLAAVLIGSSPGWRLHAAEPSATEPQSAPAASPTKDNSPSSETSSAPEENRTASPSAQKTSSANVSAPSESSPGPAAPAPPAPPARPKPVHRHDGVSIFSNSHLAKDEVANDFVTIFGNSDIEGTVHGDAVTIMGNCNLSGTVNGNVVDIGGNLNLSDSAVVRGDVVAVGGKISQAPGAYVTGQTTNVPFFGGFPGNRLGWLQDWIHSGLLWGRLLPINLHWVWAAAAFFFLLNIILGTIFRRPVSSAMDAIDHHPIASFFSGMLALILVGPACILLLATVIGIPAVPFVMAGLALAVLLGMIAVYQFTGQQIGLGGHPLLALIVGQLIFLLLFALPVIGLLLWMVTLLIGLGAMFVALGRNKNANGNRRKAAARSVEMPREPQQPANQPSPPTSVAAVAKSPETETQSAPAGEASSPGTAIEEPETPTETQPPPAYPPVGFMVRTEYPRVGFMPRLGATALDFLLITILSGISGLMGYFILFWFVYHVAFWSWRATTLGGIVFNLRIDRLDGRKVDFGVALVRSLGSVFSFLLVGLGFLWVIWDADKQSWHDKIAGTTIVRTPKGTSLI